MSSCRRSEDLGNRCIMNIHIGASLWNSCEREKQAAGRRSITSCVAPQLATHTHTHTLLGEAGGGNLSVRLLQATGGDAQQQGSSVISMWCRCSEVNLPSTHFHHNNDLYVQNLANIVLFIASTGTTDLLMYMHSFYTALTSSSVSLFDVTSKLKLMYSGIKKSEIILIFSYKPGNNQNKQKKNCAWL